MCFSPRVQGVKCRALIIIMIIILIIIIIIKTIMTYADNGDDEDDNDDDEDGCTMMTNTFQLFLLRRPPFQRQTSPFLSSIRPCAGPPCAGS